MIRRSQGFAKTFFVDFLLMSYACMVGLMMLNNQAREKQLQEIMANIRTDGLYAVTMEWPDKSLDDLDLYVADPDGNIAYFSARDVGLMHLEHDDQGYVSDTSMTSSGEVKVERNEERIILRAALPGEYVVNAHMYNKRDPQPTKVTFKLFMLRSMGGAVVERVREIAVKGDEVTAFRFTLKSNGSVAGVNELERKLTGADALQQQGSPFRPRGGF